MKTRIVVRVPIELLKAFKPAAGQLSMFGGTQPVTVKPHTRVTESGKAAQVQGYTEQRRAAAEKEPHEMSHWELRGDDDAMRRMLAEHYDATDNKMMAHRMRTGDTVPTNEISKVHKQKIREAIAAGKTVPHEVLADYPDLKSKEPHEMTLPEFRTDSASHFKDGSHEMIHRIVIERAIAAGKHVPPHVLADYPDLKPKEEEKPIGSVADPSTDDTAVKQSVDDIMHWFKTEDFDDAVKFVKEKTTLGTKQWSEVVRRAKELRPKPGPFEHFQSPDLDWRDYVAGLTDEQRQKVKALIPSGGRIPHSPRVQIRAIQEDLLPSKQVVRAKTATATVETKPKKPSNVEYEPLTTKSGRQIQPPSHSPMLTDRTAKTGIAKHDQWLVTEAAAEAKHRGDDWNYDNFSRLVGQKIHDADRTGANLYLFDQEEVPLKQLRKSLRLVIRKSLVHAYQRRTQTGQPVQVQEYSNKVQKRPEQPTRAVVRMGRPQAKYKPGLQKPGPSIGETSSGAVIHADSHRVHAGWSKTDHFEAAQAHRSEAERHDKLHRQHEGFEGELGASAHPDADSQQAVAHRARAAYHSRMADGDSEGAAAIAKYDHRFREHLEGNQAEEQHGTASEPAAHDSEKFIADMVQEILAGAQPQGRGGELSVSTQKLHKLPDGTYKPERQAMHKRILEARLAKAVKQEQPEAVFMGGGSASGKGAIQKRGLISLPQGAVVADADLMKVGDPEGHETGTPFHGIPEFGQLSKGGKSDMAAAFVHEESSDLNADLANACYENGYHVIVDGTGDGSVAKMGKRVALAKAAGHKVRAIYCTVPTDMAVDRSMERAKKTGREVPEKAVRELHVGVSRLFPEVTKLFDDLELWDNTAEPKLIYSKKSDRGETVHDPKAYQQFLAKANESSDERFDRATGKVTPMQKAMGGDKKRVKWVPSEWPDADKRDESLRRLKKMGLHEHSKRKKQQPRKHGRHR